MNFNKKQFNKNQGGKNWCYTENFMSLTISNLRTTAFCFENTKLLKQILNNTVFYNSKKIGHPAHKSIFKFSKTTFR